MNKFTLNEEYEFFIGVFGIIFPTIFFTILILIEHLYFMIIILFIWLLIFGYLFKKYRTFIYVFNDKFIIKKNKKEYEIKFDNIKYITYIRRRKYLFVYYINLHENDIHIPKRMLKIYNNKIDKILDKTKFVFIEKNRLE